MAPAAGTKVAWPVFDDSSTLLTLFGVPVPDRCRIPWWSPGVPSWSPSGFILVPFWFQLGPQFGINLGPVWFQFGPQFGPHFGPNLVPVWSQIGPSLVPDWFQLGLKLVLFWSHFGAWFSSNLVPV